MSYLPVTPAAALATKQELRELRDENRHLSMRIDRLQLTLIAGFISMVVALIAVGSSAESPLTCSHLRHIVPSCLE